MVYKSVEITKKNENVSHSWKNEVMENSWKISSFFLPEMYEYAGIYIMVS